MESSSTRPYPDPRKREEKPFFRQYLGIAGRDSHTRVNPFLRGSGGAEPIDFTAVHPSAEIDVLWEFNPGEKSVREVRQIVFIDPDGRTFPVRIPDWMRTSDQLREEMTKRGLRGKYSARVFAADGEMEWIEGLCTDLGGDFKWLPPSEGGGHIEKPRARVTVTGAFFRAVAKVGFHYLLAAVDTWRGDEFMFDPIRTFIRHGAPPDQFVTNQMQQILTLPEPGVWTPTPMTFRPKRWGHVVVVEGTPDGIRARLQFFLGPRCEPSTYTVALARGHGGGTWSKGHYFVYLDAPEGRVLGEATELTASG